MSDSKTPREWLLSHRASVTPRLDALRRGAMSAPELTWRYFFREIFRPQRNAWRLIAATWIALLVFQLTLGRPNPPSIPPLSPAAVAAWFAHNSHETFAQINNNR